MDDHGTTAERIAGLGEIIRKAERLANEIYQDASPQARALIDRDPLLEWLSSEVVAGLARRISALAPTPLSIAAE